MAKIAHDSFGDIEIPDTAIWGGVTQRAIEKFRIGQMLMQSEVIHAIAAVKYAAAKANSELGLLDPKKADAICESANRVFNGEFDSQFPLLVWQTGSGTATNMNVNEVIASLATQTLQNNGEVDLTVHPNDDVNKGQSTNDVFPSAMHISALLSYHNFLRPVLKTVSETISKKSEEAKGIIKIGRTHLQDATPLYFSDEINSWKIVIDDHIERLDFMVSLLRELPLGGTAVGSGTNCAKEYPELASKFLTEFLGQEFHSVPNKMRHTAFRDSLLSFHGEVKTLATSFVKIGNDIRFYSSGPRAGFGETSIPANEPGSSIMPGKVNPTQIEVLSQVCAQIIGNDAAVTFAVSQGNFQLNVYMPVIIHNVLQSVDLLSKIVQSFNDNLLVGLKFNNRKIEQNLSSSLMLVTALAPSIGYENSAKIAKFAHANDISLLDAIRELRSELGLQISDSQAKEMLKPQNMV